MEFRARCYIECDSSRRDAVIDKVLIHFLVLPPSSIIKRGQSFLVQEATIGAPLQQDVDKRPEAARCRDMQHALPVTTLRVQIDAVVKQEKPRFVSGMSDMDKGTMLIIPTARIDVEVTPEQEVN